MKLIWSGLGFVVPLVASLGFLVALFTSSSGRMDAYWLWGVLAFAVAAVAMPIGFVVNGRKRRQARGGSSHHFMFVPMQWWGVLLAVVGMGFFTVELLDTPADDRTAEAAPCAELADTMSACTGPATAIAAMCTFADAPAQAACATCVRSAADPCNPTACQDACDFRPGAR